MFSQQWREKKCFCGVTKYLNIISVLYKQTHNAVYYIMCFVLLRQYPPSSALAELSVVMYSAQEETPDSVSTVKCQ